MTLAQKLSYDIENLPQEFQQEVIDLVARLKQKLHAKPLQEFEKSEDHLWSTFALSSALQGLEDENTYSEADLKEKWQ